MLSKEEILKKIQGGLIVSCQALPHEPLYSSEIMARMAYAASLGGAKGIRANTPKDIVEIKKVVSLPVIGLFKKEYPDSKVYITPTEEEVDALMDSGPDIIALDATNRPRPYGVNLDAFFQKIRSKYPDMLFMADCSTYEEGLHASKLGFDLVGTTLCGYTETTKGAILPAIDLMERLTNDLQTPVIAEGGIWTPEQLQQVFSVGVYAAVVGTAITRPMDITKRFVKAIKNQ